MRHFYPTSNTGNLCEIKEKQQNRIDIPCNVDNLNESYDILDDDDCSFKQYN